MEGTKAEGNGIPSGTSGCPYGRGRSEIFENNKEAAQGPSSSCRATREADETDPRILRIPGEVGCRLQEGVPPCSSGMAEEEPFQEYSDLGKLWTVAGLGRRWNEDEVLYRSRTAQGTRNPGSKGAPGRQNGRIEPRRQMAAMFDEGKDINHKWQRSVEVRAAITSGKRRNAHEGPIWDG
jgi:hypothetical protein